jgi:hypothetical protein
MIGFCPIVLFREGPAAQLNASPLHHATKLPPSSSQRGVMVIAMAKASSHVDKPGNNAKRRDFLRLFTVGTAISTTLHHNVHWRHRKEEGGGGDGNGDAVAAGLPEEEPLKLCDLSCEKELENVCLFDHHCICFVYFFSI